MTDFVSDLAAPDWFNWAVARPHESRFIPVAGAQIHYLFWPADAGLTDRGILFVHGGGAHARWWQFIAPFFTRDYNVAALDLSGMGDSEAREDYSAEVRAKELLAVLDHAGFGAQAFIVGHSFGGYMTMKFGALYSQRVSGAVIVDSPVRSPEEQAARPMRPPSNRRKRIYPSFEAAVARFRLMPEQSCENPYIVKFIGRHSVKQVDEGWTWKFDGDAMGARRFGEPFHEHLQQLACRSALLFGEQSALVSRATAHYMSALMGPRAPIVEVPQAQHHVMLDQPLAFVATLRMLLENWSRQ